ncbi:sulfite oxidase [Streptomyces sp. CRN 30]|uniref:sulfite oxidase n=1 Tax=Streptomyces sp. CRN 30 TaxID=3075613 RepID=UPI002A7F1F12|nr:sulfite oxidase [Streptomyces sp. CRN 30]
MSRTVAGTTGARTQEHLDEHAYDRARSVQWLAGAARTPGTTRRDMLRLATAAGLVTAAVPGTARAAAARDGAAVTTTPTTTAAGIVKPLPPELFTVRGTNAETRFDALRGTGLLTPADRFFVRNHTTTPLLDAGSWQLELHGSGLRGAPGRDRPVRFGLDDLKALPATSLVTAVECAGNGRSFYAGQQGETVSGTSWTLGAIGVARWRGVRLGEVLRRAGVRRDAVDVLPSGLDAPYTSDGTDHGHVRRPLPLAKALDDVLLAYEMNGEPLPPDHGAPVRVVVPSWVGIASIKWVGDIEVSAEPLLSPWNTLFYRLFGAAYPPGGSAPLTRQTLKSAFELPWPAAFAPGRPVVLHGRSWSGGGSVRRVDVSTDGGRSWHPARLRDTPRPGVWARWEARWTPRTPGPVELLARATDSTGRTQPERSVHNTQGYLFDAVVRHPATVG